MRYPTDNHDRQSIRRMMPRLSLCVVAILSSISHAADETAVGEQKPNLPFREALYSSIVDDPMETSGRILADQKNELYEHRADYAEMLLGNAYLKLGLHWQASSSYYELLQRDDRVPVTDQAWFDMAKTQFHRGYLGLTGLVEYALSRIRPDASEEILAKKSLLLGQLYLEQGRFNDAAKLLDEWKGPRELRQYVQYNLAVALINNGQREQGLGRLSGVGRFGARDSEQMALRDKANLVMAYELMKDGQGATARPVIKRVRVGGPYSNKALLAMGWAHIGPQGDYQTRAGIRQRGCLPPEVESVSAAAGIMRAKKEECDEAVETMARFQKEPSKEEKHLDALKPWLTLKQRDPNDLAVQEALLAVPHAFLELGAKRQAMRHFQDAVEIFGRERDQLSLALKHVQTDGVADLLLAKTELDGMPQQYWELEEFPKTEETVRLSRLIAGAPFQESLRGYEELKFLNRKLNEWEARLNRLELAIAPNFENAQVRAGKRSNRNRVATGQLSKIIDGRQQLAEQRKQLKILQHRQKKYVQSLAVAELTRQKEFLEVYMAEAQLGLGSIFDEYVEDEERRADEIAADEANNRERTATETAPQ